MMNSSVEEVLGWGPVQYYLNDTLDWDRFRKHQFFRRELQYILRQEDRLGMWFSIETRTPFLDHEFVEFTGRLSPEFLYHDGYLKYPLRLLSPELPESLRFNPLKRGFWDDYSAIPFLRVLGNRVVQSSKALTTFIAKPDAELEPAALWRFLQVAILSEIETRQDISDWLADYLPNDASGRSWRSK